MTWVLVGKSCFERVPNSFPTLGGTDSTTTNYIRSITLPQAPKGTQTTLAAVILGFSTLSGTNPQILTAKRYDERPRHFYRGVTLFTFTARRSLTQCHGVG